MTSLKQKTISGLTWSIIEKFSKNGVTFIFGIILARLLTPREFGLIGMTSFFVAFLQPFAEGGLTTALIRKKDCTQEDYSTVFYYNIIVSILIYLILFFSAGYIANFFDEPKLKLLVRVLCFGIIIQSLATVQGTILTKRIDFKLLAKITVISVAGAGIVGVILAYKGFGVWSLVFKHLTLYSLTSLMIILLNGWRPSLTFNWKSFREMFSFGWKMLASGLLNQIQRNISKLVIGKYFSATELGYYTRAENFKNLPSQNISQLIQRVTFPVLSSIQDDIPKLKATYKRLIRSTMLVTFISMMVMAAIAKPMILTLIGEKWLPSVTYLQLLCFVGMLFPLQALNSNMLLVQGRSDIYLRIEILKKILLVPVFVIGIKYGINAMIIAMFVHYLIAYLLKSRAGGKMVGYPTTEQIKDILPSFFLAIFIGVSVYSISYFISAKPVVTLLIQLFLSALLAFGTTELLQMKDYLYLKEILIDKLLSVSPNNKQN